VDWWWGARALAKARQRTAGAAVSLVRADLETGEGWAALADGNADAVVSFETLEHLVQAECALALFARLFRPRGHLICSVPNAIHEGRALALLPCNRRYRRLFSLDSLVRSTLPVSMSSTGSGRLSLVRS
jgi:SAM-dependent methyltransferase